MSLYMSIPLKNEKENEVILSILSDLILSFPSLLDEIPFKPGPEIDVVCSLAQSRSINSMKFLSLVIHIKSFFLDI